MLTRPSARFAGLLSATLLALAGASGAATAAPTRTTAAQATRPDLVITAVSLSARSVTAGHSVTITATTKNQGTGPAAASVTGYYLSRDKTWSKSDKQLGTRKVARLAPKAKVTGKSAVTVPSGKAAGTYYVLACADAKKTVAESNEKNNCRAAGITIRSASHTFPMKANPLTTFRPTFTNPSFTSGSGAATPGVSTTLTETMPDGTVYSLSVPANAVSQSVTLTMTPVATLTGAPTTWVAGVSLQPAGLELYQDATLTITPTAGLGKANTAFRFFGGGADPGMYPIARYSKGSFTLPVSTLATYGVGASTIAQRATMRAHPPVRTDGQLDNVVGPLTGPAPSSASSPDLGPAVTARPADFIADLLHWYDTDYIDVVKPGLTAALTNESQAASAIAHALAWAHDLGAIGADDDPRVGEIQTLMLQILRSVVPHEYQRCHAEHSLGDLGLLLSNARIFAIFEGENSADFNATFDDAVKCGRFTVTWHSVITQVEHFTGTGDVTKFDLSAAYNLGTGPVDLGWGAGGFTGQAKLHYNSASYQAHYIFASCGSTEDSTLTATHDIDATVTLEMPFMFAKGPGVDPIGATLTISPNWLVPISQNFPPDETYHVKDVDKCPPGSTVQADEVLPGWQLAVKSAGLPNPLPMTVDDAATVFDQTFTFDGTAAYSLGTIHPHEHSDTTVTILHTPA